MGVAHFKKKKKKKFKGGGCGVAIVGKNFCFEKEVLSFENRKGQEKERNFVNPFRLTCDGYTLKWIHLTYLLSALQNLKKSLISDNVSQVIVAVN